MLPRAHAARRTPTWRLTPGRLSRTVAPQERTDDTLERREKRDFTSDQPRRSIQRGTQLRREEWLDQLFALPLDHLGRGNRHTVVHHRQKGQQAIAHSVSRSRKYDWAGLRLSRGLVPRALRRSHQSHLRRSDCRTVALSHCRGDQPMSSSAAVAPAPASPTLGSIISLGLDVHKSPSPSRCYRPPRSPRRASSGYRTISRS